MSFRTYANILFVLSVALFVTATAFAAPDIHWTAGDINGNGTGADNPADGSEVTSWVDKGAGSHDASQSGEAPVFIQSAPDFNGNPAVAFDGSAGLSAADSNSLDVGTNGFTAFVVASVDDNGSNSPHIFFDHRDGAGERFRGQTFFIEYRGANQTSDGSGAGMTLGAQVNSHPDVIGFNTPADGSNKSANPLIPDAFEDSVARIYSVVFDRETADDPAGVLFGINSTATMIGAKDDGTSPEPPLGDSWSNADFTIGYGPLFGGAKLKGRIGEILIYHEELSESAQLAVLNGLGTKYDISIVPEPSTCLLMVVGSLALVFARRMRRR